MTYVAKGADYLPTQTMKELVALYNQEKDAKAVIRLLCAINRKKGNTITAISELLEIPTSTVSDHLRRLAKHFDDLYDKRNQHRPPKLKNDEYKKLIETLKKPPTDSNYPAIIWTTKMVQHLIMTQFSNRFTEHGVRKLLYRAGFTLQRPRPEHAKGNKKQQALFKKNYPQSLVDICMMDMRSSFWMNVDSL